MQRYLKRAIDLIAALAITNEKNPSVVEPHHTKGETSGAEVKYFKRVSPTREGVSPLLLRDMLLALEAEPRANVHNLMVLRGGRVILECSAPGYDTNTYHLSHSMSKTVTGIAMGMLIEEKGLDISTRLVDIFPEYEYTDKRVADITVEHLLSMRSGVAFSELGTATETEWTKTFFSGELLFSPGERFHYNSLNSYILARIICRISGMGLVEYLKPRLFEPLKIKNFLWEIGPEGIEKGGFGLYMSTESWAKIGVMLLNMGVFEGKQIVPRGWVLRSITERSIAPESVGAFNYGYHIWVNRTNDEFLLNGMLGQNVWVCPKNNIVVAANCGNGELFQGSPTLDIIRNYLGGELEKAKHTMHDLAEFKYTVRHFFEKRHQIRPKPHPVGLRYTLGLKSAAPFDENLNPLLGEYAFFDNNTGLLPLFVSVMQNNFSGGIERIEFKRVKNSLIMLCTEGGIVREIPVGIYGFKTSELVWGGERYIVNAICEALEDEDRNPIYKLELVFPELPNSRLIKFTLHEGRLVARLSEAPNQKFVETFIAGFLEGGKVGFAMNFLERKMGEDFIIKKVVEVFNPQLSALPTSTPGFEEILEEENRLKREMINKSSGFLMGIVNKFTGEDKEEKQKEKRGGFFGLFGRRKQSDSIPDTDGGEYADGTEAHIITATETDGDLPCGEE